MLLAAADERLVKLLEAAAQKTATQVELDGQYRALREEAGFLPRDRTALLVKGPDAAEYLQGQLTNDTEAIEPDQGVYAALPGPHYYLHALMIEPAEQGKGLGLRFLDGVREQVVPDQRGTIILDCWAGNHKLRDFYAREAKRWSGVVETAKIPKQ